MKKGLTIAAVAALALGVAACGSKNDTAANNTSSEDNMLVPADENSSAMGDMNAGDNMAMDNSAMGDMNAGAGNNAM